MYAYETLATIEPTTLFDQLAVIETFEVPLLNLALPLDSQNLTTDPLFAVVAPSSTLPLQLPFVPRRSFVELLPAAVILITQPAQYLELRCMRNRSMGPPLHPYRRILPVARAGAVVVVAAIGLNTI